MILFGVCIVILIVLTVFESFLGTMSLGQQRLLTVLGYVLPAGVGSVLGGASLLRREKRPWLAVAGAVLNGLFALFHLMIVLFAG